MKRVLIICDSFPPYGGLRAGCLAKYLPGFGWDPEVLAWKLKNDYSSANNFQGLSPLDENHINWVTAPENPALDARYSIFDRFRFLLRPELSRPVGLLEKFISAAENRMDLTPVRAIIATTSGWLPVFGAAARMSDRSGIPWIADLRDIDEQWPHRDADPLRLKAYRYRGIVRRQQLLKKASAIVTISRWHRRFLEKKCRRPVELIYNGFDPEHFSAGLPSVNRDNFFITYTVALLTNNAREPDVFFQACQSLIKEDKGISEKLKIRFFSPTKNSDTIEALAKEHGLEGRVYVYPQIEHARIPFVLSESAILLLITSRHTRGQMTTKLYEYLASRRPVLCVPEDDGSIKAILTETEAGICTDSIDEAARFIKACYCRWTDTRNDYAVHRADLSLYSRKNQAGNFAQLLNRISVVK